MKEMKTIVYFNPEATGLKNPGKPRISELSLVAVNNKDILDYHLIIHALKEKANKKERIDQIEQAHVCEGSCDDFCGIKQK